MEKMISTQRRISCNALGCRTVVRKKIFVRVISCILSFAVIFANFSAVKAAKSNVFSSMIPKLLEYDKESRALVLSAARSVLGIDAGIEMLEISLSGYTAQRNDLMGKGISKLLSLYPEEQLKALLAALKSIDESTRYSFFTDLIEKKGKNLTPEQTEHMEIICSYIFDENKSDFERLSKEDDFDESMVAHVLSLYRMVNDNRALFSEGEGGMLKYNTLTASCKLLIESTAAQSIDELIRVINSQPKLTAAIKATGSVTGLYANTIFMDTENHWAAEFIWQIYERNIFVGYEDGTFRPDNKLTRQEMAVAVVKMLGLYEQTPDENVVKFKDDENIADWARSSVYVLSEKSIFKGYDNGNFEPDGFMTREEFAAVLSRTENEAGVKCPDLTFADSSRVSLWALDAVKIMVNRGVITGYEDNTVRPQNALTRAEACTMMYKLLNKY